MFFLDEFECLFADGADAPAETETTLLKEEQIDFQALQTRLQTLEEEVQRLREYPAVQGKPVLSGEGARAELAVWLISHTQDIETQAVLLVDYDTQKQQWVVDPVELGPSTGNSPGPRVSNEKEEALYLSPVEGCQYHMRGPEVTDTGFYPPYADAQDAKENQADWEGARAVLYLKDGEILAIVRMYQV